MTQYKALIVPDNWREGLITLREKEPRLGNFTAMEMYSTRISVSSANIIILTLLNCPRMMRLLVDFEAWYREWSSRVGIEIGKASKDKDYPFETASEIADFIEWIRLKMAIPIKGSTNLNKMVSLVSNLYLVDSYPHTFETIRGEVSILDFVGEDENDG